MFFKTLFEFFERKQRAEEASTIELAYWKTMVAFYGSDAVITKLTRFVNSSTKENFDDLLLQMRKDTAGATKLTAEELEGVSPLLNSTVRL